MMKIMQKEFRKNKIIKNENAGKFLNKNLGANAPKFEREVYSWMKYLNKDYQGDL